MRSRVLGATVAALLTAVMSGACADMDDGAAEQTLPVIQTTTIVTTTLPPTTSQPRFYEIQSGDTLIEIAAAFGLPVQAIMEANGIVDANRILAGQILRSPWHRRSSSRRCRRSPRRRSRRQVPPSRRSVRKLSGR